MIHVADIERAKKKVQERIDQLDEQIATLCLDCPGDPGVVVWPREIADALDRAHDERENALEQMTMLDEVLAQLTSGASAC